MKKELSEGRLIWLVAMFYFLQLVNGRRNQKNVHPHLLLSCVPPDQHSGHAVGSGKKEAANQGTTNHRQGFSVSIISRERARAGACTYTYAQAFFFGLCSHQCVQLDREREDGRNSWGSEAVQLSNYKLWGPGFSMTVSQQLLEFTVEAP